MLPDIFSAAGALALIAVASFPFTVGLYNPSGYAGLARKLSVAILSFCALYFAYAAGHDSGRRAAAKLVGPDDALKLLSGPIGLDLALTIVFLSAGYIAALFIFESYLVDPRLKDESHKAGDQTGRQGKGEDISPPKRPK